MRFTLFQICMLLDIFAGTNILSAWVAIYLALPILSSSAFNPWVYGYRNSELRVAVRRIIDELLNALGFTYRSHQHSDPIVPSNAATAGDHASFINHVQRECFSLKAEGDFLLVPIAKQESSGFPSDSDTPKVFRDNPRIVITSDAHRVLKGSRSMIESLAISRGSDVVIVKGVKSGMIHGASVV